MSAHLRKPWFGAMAAACLAVLALAPSAASQSAGHDKAFWQGIVKNKYALPAGEPLPALVRELSGYLGSSDPELRDDIGYSTLVAWIYRQKVVPIEMRRALLAEWTANLRTGIGTRGTDTIFLRSFSALALGIFAALDNDAAWLEPAEFNALLTAALTYLRDEVDVRGFDPAKGWMHSAAHTADLLKFLARSRHLQPGQQAVVLDAVLDKMSRTEEVFTHGEDERLARAVLSIAARPDFDEAAFGRWAAKFVPLGGRGAPTPASLATTQNRKNLAVAVYSVLSADARDLPSIPAARAIMLATLKKLM
jgi:hypothetical protein